MKYDVIIIGGGLAGLTAALKLSEQGRRTAVFSAGMNALHFSSGSIDLLGHRPDGSVVYEPFTDLPGLASARPDHPYARCGPGTVREALDFLVRQAGLSGLELYANGDRNHFHVTALGTLKPTFLSPASVFDDGIKSGFERGLGIAILNFEGYRDFHPALAAANLARHRLFENTRIVTADIRLPRPKGFGRPVHELRSVDIARLFDSGEALDETAALVKKAAGDADLVALPAVLGLSGSNRALKTLRELTGKLIYEVPTLPPSIPGLRLDEALKTRLAALGGVYIAGDRVVGGQRTGSRLDHVHTRNYGPARLSADHFILAAGSFFSGGLTSRFDRMDEPVFGLKMYSETGRSAWSARKFFDPGGHGFLSYGVVTDDRLNPWGPDGEIVRNLYCAGAVLARYDPVREACGGGVAAATGYRAALHILDERRRNGA